MQYFPTLLMHDGRSRVAQNVARVVKDVASCQNGVCSVSWNCDVKTRKTQKESTDQL